MGATASIFQSTAALGGAYSESQALQREGNYKRDQILMNARFADMQAEDAIARGDKAASTQTKQVKQMVGSQRAALAAQGIDINSGSARDVISDTESMGALDRLQIKSNAWREAWGYKVQAVDQRSQASMTSIGARAQAGNTLLTGGMKALGYAAEAYGKLPAREVKKEEAKSTNSDVSSSRNYFGNRA